MAEGEGETLFVRNRKLSGTEECGSTTEDDIWDDTALVEAYDRAVSLAKEEVTRRMGLAGMNGPNSSTLDKKKSRKKKHNSKEWHVGSPCRAVYSKDGEIYEATIESIQANTGICVIRYIGYNNEELVPLKQLQPSGGPAACIQQAEQAAQYMQSQENGLNMEYSEGEEHKGPMTNVKTDSFSKSPPRGRVSGRTGPYPQQFPPFLPPMGFPSMMIPPPPPPHITSSCPDEDAEALSAMLLSWYMSGFHTGYYQGLQHHRKSQNNFRQNPSRKT